MRNQQLGKSNFKFTSVSLAIVIASFAAFCFFQMSSKAFAQPQEPVTRAVGFELDAVEDAVSYDVEISKPNGKIVGHFHLKSPVWTGRLAPGKYRLRSRSTDSRGVPGDWSDYDILEVFALAPKIISPALNSQAARQKDGRVSFAWEAGGGAARYKIEIESTNGEFKIAEFVEGTSFSAWIPKGTYKWSVASLLSEGAGGEKSQSRGSFELPSDLDRSLVGQADLKWKPIEGAKSYEVEIKNSKGELVAIRGTSGPAWTSWFQKGEYSRRVRPVSAQGKSGEWGDPENFQVLGFNPHVTSPTADSIDADGELESRVSFAWEPSAEAKQYKLKIENVDPQGNVITDGPSFTDTTNSTSMDPKLVVGKAYVWRVIPIDSENREMVERETKGHFTLLGKELQPPKIDVPLSKFVNELSWHSSDVAKYFDYKLEHLQKGKGWTAVEKKENIDSDRIPFPYTYSGGRYRLSVRSVGEFRKPSKPSSIVFSVHNGDRRPEATYRLRLRESIDRPTGAYFLASYLVTSMAYTGQDAETNSVAAFNAFGGTGRLGIGYNPQGSAFGYLGILDLSGFRISDRNYTFASAEGHVNWTKTYDLNSVRASAGLFYKELVEVRGELGQLGTNRIGTIATVGPHAGVEITRPLTPEYGLQFNARLYMSTTAVKTPNGKEGIPTLSYQFGLMGSKKLRKFATGYIGYAYRVDSAAYKSTPNDDSSSTITSLATDGDAQRVSITGHYLNLLLEWGF